jgi:hypothetical protein
LGCCEVDGARELQLTNCGAVLSTVLRMVPKVSDECKNVSNNYRITGRVCESAAAPLNWSY